MYHGTVEVTLDDKGRIAVPTRFREALLNECAGRLVLSAVPEQIVVVMPWPVWEREVAGQDARDYRAAEDHALLQQIFATADERQIDKQGRLPVSRFLRDHAGLKREAVLWGVRDRLELLSPQSVAERMRNWSWEAQHGERNAVER